MKFWKVIWKKLKKIFKKKKEKKRRYRKKYKRTKKTERIKKQSKRRSLQKRERKESVLKEKDKVKKVKDKKESFYEKEVGVITHYFDRISVGVLKLKSKVCCGDYIHIKGKDTDFTQVIESMQVNHKDILCANKNDEVGIKVIMPVKRNDKVYKKLNNKKE